MQHDLEKTGNQENISHIAIASRFEQLNKYPEIQEASELFRSKSPVVDSAEYFGQLVARNSEPFYGYMRMHLPKGTSRSLQERRIQIFDKLIVNNPCGDLESIEAIETRKKLCLKLGVNSILVDVALVRMACSFYKYLSAKIEGK